MGSYGGAGDLSMSCFSLSCGHFSKHDMDTHVLVLGWMAVGGGRLHKAEHAQLFVFREVGGPSWRL